MSDPKAVRYNKLSTQGIVLWLDYSNLATLIVAVAIVVAATQNAGVLGFIITAPLWVFLTVVGVQKRHGVPLPVVYWREIMFILRKALGLRGQVLRPERVVVPAALGKLNLPGRAGYLQLWETPDGVLTVFDPQLQTASISCLVYGDDFLGSSNSTQDARIEAWARTTVSAKLRRFGAAACARPSTVRHAMARDCSNIERSQPTMNCVVRDSGTPDKSTANTRSADSFADAEFMKCGGRRHSDCRCAFARFPLITQR